MAKPRVPKSNGDVLSVNTSPEAPSAVSVAADENGNGSPAKKTLRNKKIAAKPEIVKTDGRANLVPINLEDEIRRLAYLLSERRGFEPGHEAEDWLAAEREVRQRYHHQHSA